MPCYCHCDRELYTAKCRDSPCSRTLTIDISLFVNFISQISVLCCSDLRFVLNARSVRQFYPAKWDSWVTKFREDLAMVP